MTKPQGRKLERPEGIPADHPEPWHDALHYYHLAVRAEACAALDWPGDWREQLGARLAAEAIGSTTFRTNSATKRGFVIAV